jgi:hypothetical protein
MTKPAKKTVFARVAVVLGSLPNPSRLANSDRTKKNSTHFKIVALLRWRSVYERLAMSSRCTSSGEPTPLSQHVRAAGG